MASLNLNHDGFYLTITLIILSCKSFQAMQKGNLRQNSRKLAAQKEDINSKKTRFYHKAMNSDKDYKTQRSSLDQKVQIADFAKKQRQTERSRRNYSVKDSKCDSDVQYKNIKKDSKQSQDIDGKTELNKIRTKLKNQEIQDELEHQQLVREGLANSFNEKKLKMSTQKRQIIFQDILHPPINLKPTKSEKKQLKISQTESQRLEDNQYDDIINEINLNNLESKVVHQPIAPFKKDQTFLAKIQQSESEVAASPINYQKLGDFNQKQSIIHSPTKPLKVSHKQSQHQENASVFNMDSIEEEAINQSVERTFNDNHKTEKAGEYNLQITVQPCESQVSEERLTEKKSNKVEQNKIIINTKVNTPSNQPPKSIKKAIKQQNKLTIVNGIIEAKVSTQDQVQSKQQQQKKKLNEQISELKLAVRELKLEKIKARAEMNMTIDSASFRTLEQKSRYQTLNSFISERQQNEGENPIFGRIRKNRSLSKKNSNYALKSQQLTLEKQLDLPEPIINIKKLPQKSNHPAYMTERKIPSHFQDNKQYKTISLQRIAEENMEQSMRFQGNLATSFELPIYGTSLRSNKISMRGPEICTEVLSKFESSDKRFKKFVHLSSARSRVHTNSQRIVETQRVAAFKNPQISKQNIQDFQIKSNNQYQGVIIKNKHSLLGNKKHEQSSRIENKVGQAIKQGQKIILYKKNHNFKINEIPTTPDTPNYLTSTQDIMNLICQILPMSNIKYQEKDLEDCILKKYKNCIMFELKRYPSMKIIWYFNGKIYIGGWDSIKNQKKGYGKQIFKGKYYYQGQFESNKRHGSGFLKNEDDCYEGSWVNGQMQGEGVFRNQNQKVFYDGGWKESKKHGNGHYEYEGNIFEGKFVENSKEGFGVELFRNGDRYIGNYSNGKFEGEGKYIWFNRSSYAGAFREGFREGMGRWQSDAENYELYLGEFVRDKKQGAGKYIWNNRCVYEGSFFNDLKHGLGSILYPDGRYMEGVWTQGILTDVLNKVTEANREEPLEEPRSRTLQTRTRIKITDKIL